MTKLDDLLFLAMAGSFSPQYQEPVEPSDVETTEVETTKTEQNK